MKRILVLILIITAFSFVELAFGQITQSVQVIGTLEVLQTMECETDTYIYGGIYDGISWGTSVEVMTADGAGNMRWAPVNVFGSESRAKLYPSNFFTTDKDKNIAQSFNGNYVQAFGDSCNPIGQILIPEQYMATSVTIWGNNADTDSITVYLGKISDGTTATVLGTGDFNTEIDITDVSVEANSEVYFSIFCDIGNNERIYGGYVSIEAF